MARRLVLVGAGEPELEGLAEWLRARRLEVAEWHPGEPTSVGTGDEPLIVDADAFGPELHPMLAAIRRRWPTRAVVALTRRPIAESTEPPFDMEGVGWLHRSRPVSGMGFAVLALLGLAHLVDLDGEAPQPLDRSAART